MRGLAPTSTAALTAAAALDGGGQQTHRRPRGTSLGQSPCRQAGGMPGEMGCALFELAFINVMSFGIRAFVCDCVWVFFLSFFPRLQSILFFFLQNFLFSQCSLTCLIGNVRLVNNRDSMVF